MARRRRRQGLFETPRRRSIAGIVCILLMLVAVNVISERHLAVRFDLTAERLYTLSRGTRVTLDRIDEPVTLRFYYTARLGETIPAYGVYAQRVRELLDQYAAAAGGKLRLEVHQPLPFSEAEDRAVAFGLQGVPLNAQGEQVYFGLAGTNSTDDQQVIAFFAPERERFLEYDLTRLVHALANPKRLKVGLISELPLGGDWATPPMAAPRGGASRPNALLQQLRQGFDVEALPTALDAVPSSTDVLMLVHPHGLPDKTLFAIDQFVLRGGGAIVFVDPYSELEARSGRPGAVPASDLARLFKAWGIKLLPDTVAADRRAARRVTVPGRGGHSEALDYVAWLTQRGDTLNRQNPITANLHQITLASAGIIEPLAGATTTLEPLITTTPASMKLSAEAVAGLPDVRGLLTRFKSDDARYALAAWITGPVETAFPDGPPAEGEAPAATGAERGKDKPGEGREASVRRSEVPANLVVVADTDLLDDRLWVRSEDFFGRRVVVPVANNADFIANAIEILAGGEALVSLRGRGISTRPFTFVEEIQRAADDRYAAEQQVLQSKLKQTQEKLRELTAGEKTQADGAPTADQARTVAQFRADMVATRRELRNVQAALRQDIDRLKAILAFVNIALVPIIVAAVAVVVGMLRLRRWRRRVAMRQHAKA